MPDASLDCPESEALAPHVYVEGSRPARPHTTRKSIDFSSQVEMTLVAATVWRQ